MKNPILMSLVAVSCLTACKESPRTPPTEVVFPPRAQKISTPAEVDAASAEEMKVEIDPLGISHQDQGLVDHLSRMAELEATPNLEAALVEGRKALFDDATDEQALSETARIAKTVHERTLAALAYERLGELRPNDPEPLIEHARILIELNDGEGAQTVAVQAMGRSPDNAEAYQVLGRAQLTLGQLPEAIGSFEKTLELSPDHPYALNNLGFAYLGANRNEEAAAVLERSVERLPNEAFVHNNLGVAYERLGRTVEARMAFEDAVAADPRYVKARLNAERLQHSVAQVDEDAQSDEPGYPEVEPTP